MEDVELKNIWNEYNQRLDEAKVLNLQSWAVNIKTFEYLQMRKVRSKLKGVYSIKMWGVFLGLLWVLFLGILVYGNQFCNLFFATSVIVIMLFSIVAIALYLKHMVLINKISYGENV
ncbi:MAG TPA: hypothetical protein VGI82_11050, partial [Chitinophagaceae bacterium]